MGCDGQWAILIGVAFSVGLHIYSTVMEVRVVELKVTEDGGMEEQPAPIDLPSDAVTVLTAYGSLFFAAASNLEDKLPKVQNTRHAVVVLRLRGMENVGSTFMVCTMRLGRLSAPGRAGWTRPQRDRAIGIEPGD